MHKQTIKEEFIYTIDVPDGKDDEEYLDQYGDASFMSIQQILDCVADMTYPITEGSVSILDHEGYDYCKRTLV